MVCNKTALSRCNRDSKISDHTSTISFSRIAVESGRLSDRANVCPLFLAQAIDFTNRRQNWIAKLWFRSESEETVEDDCRGRAAGICSRHGCRYSGRIAEFGDFFA